jgi:biotin-(acetyl-CoA carboxylase) ligase
VRQEGICRGIGEDGSLTVELSGGRTESFFSGDVSLRKV